MTEEQLRDRALIVTGPAKGMGPAITRTLARAGADLVLAARDTAAAEPLAEEVRRKGGKAICVATDMAEEASIRTMTDQAIATFGERLYGLVNIAGLATPTPGGRTIWQHEAAEFDTMFDVNARGAFLLMRHLLPHLTERGRGSIVHIGGTFGHKGVRQSSLYAASKWALRGLAKCAALEAGAYGVRINIVAPGGVDLPRFDRQEAEAAARIGADPAELRTAFTGSTALGRLSTPDDIAQATLFLMSDAARNITGQDLLVDGGTIV